MLAFNINIFTLKIVAKKVKKYQKAAQIVNNGNRLRN